MLQHALVGLGEGQSAAGTAFLCERLAAGLRKLAAGGGLLAGLRQDDSLGLRAGARTNARFWWALLLFRTADRSSPLVGAALLSFLPGVPGPPWCAGSRPRFMLGGRLLASSAAALYLAAVLIVRRR